MSSDLYLAKWTQTSNESEQSDRTHANVLIYSVLALGSGCMVFLRSFFVSLNGYRAAKQMFEQMLDSLISAPMSWHDNNPSGRIMNRMSGDIAKLDGEFIWAVGSVFATGFAVIGDLLAVCIITRYLIIFVAPVALFLRKIMSVYLVASRELQRLQSSSKSPVIDTLTEVYNGTFVIRAFGRDTEQWAISRVDYFIDTNNRSIYITTAASQWFQLRIQCASACILLCICYLLLALSSYMTPGLVALSVSYGISIATDMVGLVGILAWFENCMICPERIQQYIDIPSEESQKDIFSVNNTNSSNYNSSETYNDIGSVEMTTSRRPDLKQQV